MCPQWFEHEQHCRNFSHSEKKMIRDNYVNFVYLFYTFTSLLKQIIVELLEILSNPKFKKVDKKERFFEVDVGKIYMLSHK